MEIPMALSRMNRREAQACMAREYAFKSHTGNLRAEWYQEGSTKIYTVFSYAEPIARVIYSFDQQPDGDIVRTRDVWFTPDKYSITTSNHTNLARRAIVI
jgi:hypothetical protein